MLAVLTRSFGFLLIIIMGYILRQKGFFNEQDTKTLSKIVFKISFPFAILSNVPKVTINNLTFIIILIGFTCNLIMAFAGRLFFKKESRLTRAVAMINCSSYNIGNLTMPFALTYFTGVSLEYLCMLDIGNGLLAFGGCYALARNFLNDKKDDKSGIDFKLLFKTLANSFPFLMYVFIFITSLLHITIPSGVLSIVSLVGGANSFIVMLMIGTMLNLNITADIKNNVLKILSIRVVGSIILASIIYFILPISLLARQIIALALMSSPTTLAPIFSKELGDNSSLSALVNSLHIIIAIIATTFLLVLFSA